MTNSQLFRDPESAWLATLTVLYVEDDEITRELLGHFLRRRVGRLLEAADGAEGLALFRAERPTLVITDVQMPRMDGLAMAEQIRRLDARVPIVVTTAFEHVDYLRRSIEVGVDRYVTKPVDTDKLDAALAACARHLRAEALLASERRRELEAALAHGHEALGLFAAGMAHDFNNLLQCILGNVSLARQLAPPGGDLRDLLGDALTATEQTVELGRRLLTLSEGWYVDRREGPVEPTLRAALATALGGSGTALRLELPTALPALPHDAELLGRALGQLARNAREAMADAGVLTVGGAMRHLSEGEQPPLPAGAYVALSFRDTGPGIAPDVLPRIFDPYFSTKPRGDVRGMGLGLALCAAIVRKHRGLVSVASPLGGGAQFTVLLPTFRPGNAA